MRLWSCGKISPMELVRAIAAIVRKSAYAIRLRTSDEKLHREAEALKEFLNSPLFKNENKVFMEQEQQFVYVCKSCFWFLC